MATKPTDFMKLPSIMEDWCNSTQNLDGTWGSHTHLLWRTTGCGCCSREIYDKPLQEEDIPQIVSMLELMIEKIKEEIEICKNVRIK